MDILQNLTNMMNKASRNQTPDSYQSGYNRSTPYSNMPNNIPNSNSNSQAGGLGSILTPEILGGLAGALFPSSKTQGHGQTYTGGNLPRNAPGGQYPSGYNQGNAGNINPAGLGSGGLGALGGLLTAVLSSGVLQSLFKEQIKDAMQSSDFSRKFTQQTPATPKQQSANLIRALVYAAKADGHIDSKEQTVIDAQLNKYGSSPELSSLIKQAMDEPLDPARIANDISDPEEAIQVYALSCALTNKDNFMEKSYLDSLAHALKIPGNVKTTIEAKATGQ